MSCPHCDHAWDMHTPRCTQCGCMWSEPKPPPPPPNARDLLAEQITEAIFDELDRQHEADEIDGAGYWDREWGRVDGEPDWGGIVRAIIDALGGQQ